MNLVNAARRQTALLMRPVQIGEHLHRHLRHLLGAERRLDVAAINLLVAIDGVRRATLALQLDDPIGEQIVDRDTRTGVSTSADLDDQLGSRLLGIT